MSLVSNESQHVSASSTAHFPFVDFRAVWTGVVVDVAGTLVITTLIGLAAVLGMLTRGDSPEIIVAELPASFALVLFVAAGGLLMSLAGGYVAATIAGEAERRHAFWTGMISVVLNLAMLFVIGASGPNWLNALTLAWIVPLALIGGWSATPADKLIAVREPCQK